MERKRDSFAKTARQALVFAAIANIVSAIIVWFVAVNIELPPQEIKGFFRETARAPLIMTLKMGGIARLLGEFVFLAWLYRAAKISRLAGIELPRQAPFWGILNFFIPVWRLFMPAFFMRDLAKGVGRRVGMFEAVFAYGVLYIGGILLEYASVWLTVQDVILPMRSSPEFAENIAFGLIPAIHALDMEYLALLQNLFTGFLAIYCYGYIRLVEGGLEETAGPCGDTAPAGTGWTHSGDGSNGLQDEGGVFGWPGAGGGGNGGGAPREDEN